MTNNYIFVFGSNLAGRHGKGAALTAKLIYGAKTGIGSGLAGCSYAIPTKDAKLVVRSLPQIETSVNVFLRFAASNPQYLFCVTRIGCGLAGYSDNAIAPLFREYPENVILCDAWNYILGRPKQDWPLRDASVN